MLYCPLIGQKNRQTDRQMDTQTDGQTHQIFVFLTATFAVKNNLPHPKWLPTHSIMQDNEYQRIFFLQNAHFLAKNIV